MLVKKGSTWLFIDSAAWVTAIWISALLRFDGQLPIEMNSSIWQIGFLSVTVFLIVGTFLSLYSGKYQRASLEEAQFIGLSVFITTIILFSIRILSGFSPVPRSLPIMAGFLALVFMFMARLLASPQRFRPYKKGSVGERALIYGVGIAGRQLAEQLLMIPGRYNPIGFLDDDKSISNLKIFGRPVFGTINELEKVVNNWETKKDLFFDLPKLKPGEELRIANEGNFKIDDLKKLSKLAFGNKLEKRLLAPKLITQI